MKKDKPKIKAVLINPINKTVTDIEIVPDFKHYYEIMETTIIQPLSILPRHTLWLDEEGFLKENHYFHFKDNPQQLLAGKAILVKGNTGTNSNYTAKQIKELLTFL